MATRRSFWLISLLIVALSGCESAPSGDPSLAQLERVARHLTSVRHLKMSGYAALDRNGPPSALVSYLFSDLGVAEWPASESSDAMEREQMQATRTPMLPAEGALVHAAPDPRIGKQLVLRGDDITREFVAEGYLDPKQPPVSSARWPMPELP